MRVLMVDNYDSFTYNLVHLLEALGAEVIVRRSDDVTLEDARSLAPDRLVISPGPGRPAGAGRSMELVLGLGETTPTLGVCLGHQAIVEAFGGEVAGAKALLHGKASVLRHDGRGVFAGLPSTIEAGRYHSLAAVRVPDGARGERLCPRTARSWAFAIARFRSRASSSTRRAFSRPKARACLATSWRTTTATAVASGCRGRRG